MTSRTTLGIVGSGNVGSAVAGLAARAGLETVISNSRGPETLAPLIDELGGSVTAGTVTEAVHAGRWVVVAIPFWRFPELPRDLFADKVVVDAMNFDPGRDGTVASLVADGTTPGELLQQHLSGAFVVKAFSSIFASHLESLARPSEAADRSALPVAGDDDDAKEAVVELLDILGWRAVNAGALRDSRRFDLGCPSFVAPYMADSSGDWPSRLATDPGAPVSATKLRELLQV